MSTGGGRGPRYAWGDNGPGYGDAGAIGAELDRIARRHGLADLKAIAAEDVVEAVKAEPVRYPALHAAVFESVSDDEAVLRFRVERMRRVIIALRIEVVDEGERTLYIPRVSVPVQGKGRVYMPTTAAARNESHRAHMIAECVAAMEGWRRRLADLRGADDRPEVRAFLESVDEAVSRGRAARDAMGRNARPRPAATAV